VSDAGPEEYIGSTRQPLHKRFHQHRGEYNGKRGNCSSKTLFDLYGVDNCSIVLISEMECETRQHALREERRIFDERKDTIVNKLKPITSDDEKKTRIRGYYYTEGRMVTPLQRIITFVKPKPIKNNKPVFVIKYHRIICPDCGLEIQKPNYTTHRNFAHSEGFYKVTHSTGEECELLS
jgi:hypothetical protein